MGEQENLSIFDMGMVVFEVLFKLKGYDWIILVDVVINLEEFVGIIFCLLVEVVEVEIEDDLLVFFYGLKWYQVLLYVCKMFGEEYLEEVFVYLIVIDSICFNVGMFDEVCQGGDKVVKVLIDELS